MYKYIHVYTYASCVQHWEKGKKKEGKKGVKVSLKKKSCKQTTLVYVKTIN